MGTLDETQRSQMACTFAALLLHDDRTEVNSGSIKKVCDAAGVKVPAYWPMLFAQALAGKNIGDFLSVSGGSAPAPAQGGATGGNTGGEPRRRKLRRKRNQKRKKRIWILVTCSDKQLQ